MGHNIKILMTKPATRYFSYLATYFIVATYIHTKDMCVQYYLNINQLCNQLAICIIATLINYIFRIKIKCSKMQRNQELLRYQLKLITRSAIHMIMCSIYCSTGQS